jgi:tetratricopeptide (TPR) repeat protein
MSSARLSRPRLVLSALFLAFLTVLFDLTAFSFEFQAASQSTELSKMRRIAESQHEIVMILIRKKDFGQALAEANKIFALSWPPNQEATLRKDLLYFADQFLHGGQAAVGLQLLETNLKAFKNSANRAAILKEKGYLHKNMGQEDKAIECFREAQRLETSEK